MRLRNRQAYTDEDLTANNSKGPPVPQGRSKPSSGESYEGTPSSTDDSSIIAMTTTKPSSATVTLSVSQYRSSEENIDRKRGTRKQQQDAPQARKRKHDSSKAPKSPAPSHMWKRGKGPTTKAHLSNLLGAKMSEEQDSDLDEEMQTPDTLGKRQRLGLISSRHMYQSDSDSQIVDTSSEASIATTGEKSGRSTGSTPGRQASDGTQQQTQKPPGPAGPTESGNFSQQKPTSKTPTPVIDLVGDDPNAIKSIERHEQNDEVPDTENEKNIRTEMSKIESGIRCAVQALMSDIRLPQQHPFHLDADINYPPRLNKLLSVLTGTTWRLEDTKSIFADFLATQTQLYINISVLIRSLLAAAVCE